MRRCSTKSYVKFGSKFGTYSVKKLFLGRTELHKSIVGSFLISLAIILNGEGLICSQTRICGIEKSPAGIYNTL